MKTIFRVVKNRDYSVICNQPLRNKSLSWKAKGLLAYLLTLPDDWKIHISEIKSHSIDGIDGTRAGIDELRAKGYMTLQKITDKGRIKEWIYTVYENPTR